MNGFLRDAAIFLTDTLLSLYILAFMLRLLMQVARADFINPVGQVVLAVTNPVISPLRRVIPRWGAVELATPAIMFVLTALKLSAVAALRGFPVTVSALLLASLLDLINLALYTLFFAILIRALLSWFSPSAYNPASRVLTAITEPVMRPARRLVPVVGGLDLSPIAVLLLIQLLLMALGHLSR